VVNAKKRVAVTHLGGTADVRGGGGGQKDYCSRVTRVYRSEKRKGPHGVGKAGKGGIRAFAEENEEHNTRGWRR